MKTYQFPIKKLPPVIEHIAAYHITILSLTPQNDNYVVELDCDGLPDGEYEHLNVEYDFVEVV